jgi:hypothetical protein
MPDAAGVDLRNVPDSEVTAAVVSSHLTTTKS